MPTNANLGQAIRRLRQERRVSIEVSRLLPTCIRPICQGIKREVRNPTWERITSLARALDVPVSTLVQTAEQEAEIALIVRNASGLRWLVCVGEESSIGVCCCRSR
jgi:transcriptional regulator with XRE-family HTH domain